MSGNEETVVKFFERVAARWKTNDGAEFASTFAEDASLINPFGERADRRAAIGNMYSEYFAGMLQRTSTTLEVQTVRSAEPNHAFVDAEQTIFGSNGEVVLALHLASLLRRDGDERSCVDSRPYAYSPTPS